jgi:hypothetical protein
MPAVPEPQQISILDQYDIEAFSSAHFPLLKLLYKNAFNEAISLQEIEKRFNTNALGGPVIGFIAIHKSTKTPAAYYGVFPFKAVFNNEVIQVAQRGDTMTHSDHRRKGLFVFLGELTKEACKKKGIKIIISQPNENSLPGTLNKLYWSKLDEIIRWDLKLKFKTIPLPKIARRFPFFQKLYSSFSKAILKKKKVDITSFQNSLPVNYAKNIRDSAYLAYKESNDKFFIKIESIVAWIKLSDVFWIGDFSDYEKITPLFLKKLKKTAFVLGYNTISFNLNRSIPLPASLQCFKEYISESSCGMYIDESYKNINFLITAADFDTW